MNQYQRLISYLYRYENGVKKENTGYARIELRGELCRITVQLQENMQNLSQKFPQVSLFIQKEWGMERIVTGQMSRNGNGCRCRIETRADNIMDSGKAFADLDGLLLYLRDDLFYATTWKDVSVSIGQTEAKKKTVQQIEEPVAEVETEPEDEPESKLESEGNEETEAEMKLKVESATKAEMKMETELEKEAGTKGESAPKIEESETEIEQEAELRVAQMEEAQSEVAQSEAEQIQKNCQQCDCQYCPQKGRDVDFGSHLLSIFPRMYPFQIENMGECVRLELKDIGYLPAEYWSLAGNPFLLHGYYCYRHIVFTRLGNMGYHIGVPGIYSKENQKKAEEYGFRHFQSLSEVKDIHGAFGYWFYSLENPSAK